MRYRHGSTRLAIPIVVGLVLSLGVPLVAVAEEQPAAAAPVEASPSPETRALTRAAEEGAPVEVVSRRSETAELYANPDGTFTQDTYAVPQRVRKSGRLVDIDPTLQANGDGTFSARAAEVGITFSGGGEGPMATVTRDGRSMSLSWPGALPEPSIDGDTALYANVLDDVDLKLTAGSAGFGQLLVVKTPEAAANPALATLNFPLSTDGLSVNTDEDGNLRAVNPAGQEVFTAPTPLMWDSSNSAPVAARGATVPTPPSGEFEPPYGARDAALKTEVSDGELKLTPDTQLLTGDNTRYPVYIDPSVSGSREAWTLVSNDYPNGAFYNGNGWEEGDGNSVTSSARVGWPGDTLSRSFFRMDTNNLWNTAKVITSSVFRIKNSYSYSCTDKPVEAWRTGSISSATTWSKQPAWYDKLSTVNQSLGYGSSCPAGNLAFDVTGGAKNAINGKWDNLTLGLRVPDANESDPYAYKRFDAASAVLSTTYNTTPGVPSALDTTPSTKNTAGCGNTAPYGVVGNTDVYLTAKVTDPDGGTVSAQFSLWATGHHPNDDPNGVIIAESMVAATSGTVAKLKIPKATLSKYLSVAGGNFSWKVRATDGTLFSTWNPGAGLAGCRFTFDPTRPSNPPGITSAQFPDGSDGWPTGSAQVRTKGTFTLSSSGVNDVSAYEYWTDLDPTVRTLTTTTAGGSVSLTLTPTIAGANHLYARSIDKVGNKSDPADYLYYANRSTTADEPGDLNGDGNPDLLGTDATGTLRRFYGTGNGAVVEADSTASNGLWNGVDHTHRGDWTDDGYEDVIALRPDATLNADRLWLHPNSGYGFACTDCAGDTSDSRELNVYDPANNHWADADQILAIGDVDGPLDIDGDGTADVAGFPDLLVKEGDQLWLYFGSSSGYLDETLEPVLVGDGGWSQYDLIAPGDVDHDGHVDMLARRGADGALVLYRGTGPNGEGLGAGTGRITLAASGYSAAAHPLITSGADADSNGTADFWTTNASPTGLSYNPVLTGTAVGSPTVTAGAVDWSGYQKIS
ncbi:VCBS repeat-containing protein [Streptomyces sp. NPDC002690]